MLIVLGDELALHLRESSPSLRSLHRARINAKPAVKALLGLDVKCVPVFALAVDEIDGATSVQAMSFDPDARLHEELGHCPASLL